MISSLVLITALAWTDAQANYAWSFPRDHWPHAGYKTEWWYFTGHLVPEGASEPRFGYQFTLFKVGLSEVPPVDSSWSTRTLIMGHAAITDIVTGEHRFAEVVQRITPFLGGFGDFPDPRIAWCRAPAGTKEPWTLDASGDAFAFRMRDNRQKFAMDLKTRLAKPIAFQGKHGLSIKGSGDKAASLYYSETRLTTGGIIELDGKRYTVQGDSWMDKEFGSSLLGRDQVGWDWFSLQLDDNRELMVYLLRKADGTIDWASGTLVDANGATTYLDRDDFTVTHDRVWESPASKARYPARWHVDVKAHSISIDVVPLVASQENVSQLIHGLFYWEGAVRVSGTSSGRGFVELTGYGTTLKPAL